MCSSDLLIKLTFRGSRANKPVISEATALFGVQLNILVGRIEYIEGKPLGILYVNPVGDLEPVNQALEYLREVIEEVEVIERV